MCLLLPCISGLMMEHDEFYSNSVVSFDMCY
jgi:hypothetical protein